LYTVGQDDGSQHGVGILVHNKLTGNIVSTQKISSRIAQIKLIVNKRYNLQITQVYAPTCNSSTEEPEEFYQTLSDNTKEQKNLYQIVSGDFNAKVGKKEGSQEKCNWELRTRYKE